VDVVPFLIVIVLFLTTARYIFAIERHAGAGEALEITVVGTSGGGDPLPGLGIVTATSYTSRSATPSRRHRRSSRWSPLT